MTVLLAADAVELYPPGGTDAHGWQLAGDAKPSWRGMGSLQLTGGLSYPGANDPGGHGPHAPARIEAGNLFLPSEARPAEGMVALIRGQRFVLSLVRMLVDPTDPTGGIGCWAAAVQEAGHG